MFLNTNKFPSSASFKNLPTDMATGMIGLTRKGSSIIPDLYVCAIVGGGGSKEG